MIVENRAPGRAGYTMVELAMTLVLVGIVAAITIGQLAPALDRARVRSAANVVAADLHYAQSLAVRERKTISVVLAGSRRYKIQDDEDPPVVYRDRALGSDSDFKLDELGVAPAAADFFPNGIARQTTTYTVGLKGYRRDVRVTRAGQIRITRPS